MKIAPFALSALLAAPAFAQMPDEPVIIEFNGFTVTVNAPVESRDEVPEGVDDLAARACQSVDKSAEMQVAGPVQNYRSNFLYACL